MRTPLCDFVRDYAARNPVRAHMPGHKGAAALGCEPLDITEFDGADDLFHADGVIAESEAIAGELFGARTFYSTEGSSLCIRAMLFLAAGRAQGRPLVVAARNAHKAFLSAAALIDFDVAWLPPREGDYYHACTVAAADVAAAVDGAERTPCAVYVTSPDYLGNMADIAAIAAVCRARGVPLLVDNAHGAYLKFLPGGSRHPMDLDADMCCDSAHKTLPALTGTAYLHVRREDDYGFAAGVKDAMALFGSTSPSYLLMQSLDALNPRLEALPGRLAEFLPRVEALKRSLRAGGCALRGGEPMKLTIDAAACGRTGDELAEMLIARGIYCEFHDPDFLVLMLTPENGAEDLARIEAALLAIRRGAREKRLPPPYTPLEKAMSPRAARFAARERLPVEECAGRVLASAEVGCPPAVPIAMCGERLDEAAVARFRYYGIQYCEVVME